jgi:serine/threonine protein kinase
MAKQYQAGDRPVPGYQLVRVIGQGGFGKVWLAQAPGKTEVAVKIIPLEGGQGVKEFRAVRLFKQIRHANLTPITAFWLKDETGNMIGDDGPDAEAGTVTLMSKASELVIVMALGDRNLYDRLSDCRAQGMEGVPHEELLDYIEDAAKGIDFLNTPRHDFGNGPVAVQHCDVKPQNILVVGNAAQVCDFGLARALLADARINATSTVTAAYTAPEVLAENKPSRWTDQYGLAISYYELRTGHLPFETTIPAAVLYANLQGKLDLSRVPEAERGVLRRATARRPEERYPSCLAMVRDLRRAAGQNVPPSPSEIMRANAADGADLAPEPPPAAGSAWGWAGLVLVLLALAVGVVLLVLLLPARG